MKVFVAVLFLCLIAIFPARSEEASYDKKIYEEVIAIKVMVRDMQKRLDKLEEMQKSAPAESSSGFVTRKADPETLAKINLPDNPTRDEIVKYINDIRAASAGQNCFSPSDPQVDMLMKVGSENFDVLLESYLLSPQRGTYHLRETMNKLARAEHKETVLEALPRATFLIEAVVLNGWQDDARQTLIAGLDGSLGNLPSQWIRTVANFQDPETYEALKNYLVTGPNKKSTYEALKYIPGIDLGPAVARAWDNVKFEHKCSASSMVPIAVEFGHLDALERALEDLDVTKGCRVSNARGLVLRFTDAGGSSEEIRSWFAANKDSLEFDPVIKKFRVKE